ncbi:CHAT domain-containing protein [Acaryochloris thomasi]|uniref:CHAT domain-containing protein n=1 Tax=Acaryochloris thomasi TaxID=2929456 RepID=UPI001313F2FB|nr:tetratricopeptide repeat protein [Acaryochloris thomasi]
MTSVVLLAEPQPAWGQLKGRQELQIRTEQLIEQAVLSRDKQEYRDALALFERVLTSTQRLNDKPFNLIAFSNIGYIYAALGENQKALKYFKRSLRLSQAAEGQQQEATTLNNIGYVYAAIGENQNALEHFNQALPLSRAIGDRRGEATTLSNFGLVYGALGENQKALEHYNQALPLFRSVGDRHGEATTLNNIGLVYAALGENQKALWHYNQSLLLFRAVGNRGGEATTLNNIGLGYAALGENQKALWYYGQSLPLSNVVGNQRGEAGALNNIGYSYAALGDNQKALKYFYQALPLSRAVGDRSGEATALNNIGLSYATLAKYKKALKYYRQSLPLSRAVGDRRLEAATLNNLGVLLASQKQPLLAIIFYKQSINITESLRADISNLAQDVQQSFTNSISSRYRRLANLLLQQDRIIEAQQVLDLLKLQELDEYFGDVRGNLETQKGVTVQRSEKAILDKFNEFQSAIELGAELAELRNVPLAERTEAQMRRLTELIAFEEAINADFNEFTQSKTVKKALKQLNRTAQHRTVALDELDALRANLGKLNAVLLYPFILEDRLELIITTSNSAPLRRVVPVSREQLNQAIVDFRLALEDRKSSNVQRLANKLYEWLIQPIEADLQQANAEVIIYAPDRQLRYIPLSALHDGEQWLVQRLQVNNITAKSLSNLESQLDSNLNVLAGAFVQGQYRFNIGSQSYSYSGLRYAGEEVTQLAAMIPDTTQYRDKAFSKVTFQSLMNEYQIVHFATHSTFLPGQPEDSFILFGNGDRATLREIGNWSLFNVDLVVLSACGTALGGQLGNGDEILGLGYQFQNRGAKATIASLWSVDDRGTLQLMSALYDNLKNGGISKTEALQQAKIDLITGKNILNAVVNENQSITDSGDLPKPYNYLKHPYYWAPFILIGNGL